MPHAHLTFLWCVAVVFIQQLEERQLVDLSLSKGFPLWLLRELRQLRRGLLHHLCNSRVKRYEPSDLLLLFDLRLLFDHRLTVSADDSLLELCKFPLSLY